MSLELKMDPARLKRDSKLYFVFIIIFIVAAYFFYTTGGKYYTEISKILKDTREINSDIVSLEAKITSLKSIKDSTEADVNALNISFQPEDPSLFMYSQLKVLSFKNNVELTDIAFAEGTGTEDVSVGVISFSVRGIKESVFTFLSDLGKIAPLSGLGSMTFTSYADSGSSFELDMSVDIYYSPFPKVLPDTDKVINLLTTEEKDIYGTLTKLEVMSQANFKAQEPNNTVGSPFENSDAASEALKE